MLKREEIMKRSILVTALALVLPAVANAGPITDFSLFGGNRTTLGADVIVNSGLVGSNAIVDVGGSSATLTVLGGGALTFGNSSSINALGDVIFTGNVRLEGLSHVTGDVDSGGNVSLGNSAIVDGNVRAGGSVALGGAAKVLGDIDAGKASGVAVTLGNIAQVGGTVTHKTGTTVSLGAGATVGGNAIGTPDAPAPYVATVLPTATVFSAGVTDVTQANGQTTKLAPGSYDQIKLGGTNILNLSAGSYYIRRLTIGNASDLNLDLTGGGISLFFTEDVSIGNMLDVTLTGGDASDIYAETKGDWFLGGSGEWFGTIFGSDAASDIHFGNGNRLTGALFATHNLTIDGANTVNLLQADYLTPAQPSVIPEPSSILLLGTALVGLGVIWRRRKALQEL